MKKILIILFCFISITINATIYYVQPVSENANASDSNTGTDIDSPWATWQKAFTSTSVNPGDTVYFRGGVYPISITDGSGIRVTRDGTAENWIYYWAYPGETPILDCEDAYASGTGHNRAIICQAVYCVHFKGLTVRNVFQRETYGEPYNGQSYGWVIGDAWGSVKTNVILENCTVHDVHGSAFIADHWGPVHGPGGGSITFLNCDAYNCCDYWTDDRNNNVLGRGGHGAGFSCYNAYGIDGYTYLIGCRAWNCSDQAYSVGGSSIITMDGCWSFNNRAYLNGEGNGCKMGWTNQSVDAVRLRVQNCISAYNSGWGFHTNDRNYSNIKWMNIFNNTSYKNDYWGFGIFNTSASDEEELHRVFRNNIAYKNTIAEVQVATGALYSHDHNSWDIPLSFTDADFLSVDSTGITAPRQADGSLPDNDCYKYFLRPSSTFIGYQQGTDVGLTYDAVDSLWLTPPSIGFKEYYPITPAVEPTLADVATYKPHWSSSSTASTGGYIADDGGAEITARGVCWNTTGSPTIANNMTSDGTGDGAFTSTMTGLSYGTVYYVRAYGTNSAGTSYGLEMTFRTSIIMHGGKIIKHLGKVMVIN